jgi:LPS export ABC transporter protein LptC
MINRVTIRNFLLILMLAIVGMLSWIIFRKFEAPVAQQIVESLPQNGNQALKTISYTETRGGEKLWTLSADSADHDADKKLTLLKNVHMVFYSLEGFGDVTLTSEQGSWYQGEGRIVLEGNVKANGTRGHAFHTQKLIFLQDQGIVQTDLPVKLVGPGMVIVGKGLRLDANTREIRLFSEVRGTINDQ